jgi:Domain of unknown function (DUF3576)
MKLGGLLVLAGLVLAAGGCAGDPEVNLERKIESRDQQYDISDESFFDLFRDRGDREREIGVNAYLWRASLDTLSFLPLEAADPFSGVIATDWGRVGPGGAPYRVTVYVTEPALDARSLRVAAFRMAGGRAAAVSDEENRRLENAILTRARQLRIAEARR